MNKPVDDAGRVQPDEPSVGKPKKPRKPLWRRLTMSILRIVIGVNSV